MKTAICFIAGTIAGSFLGVIFLSLIIGGSQKEMPKINNTKN